MIASCDKCNENFNLEKLQEQTLAIEPYGIITRRFFNCPHCGTEYNAGFFSARSNALIEENKTLAKEIGSRAARKQFNHNLQKIQKLSRQMQSAWNKYHRCQSAV